MPTPLLRVLLLFSAVFFSYNSASKIGFTVSLALLCMLCVSGNSRIINWFLTWWIWNPLARLTFGAYLVHPMLMVRRQTMLMSNAQMPNAKCSIKCQNAK